MLIADGKWNIELNNHIVRFVKLLHELLRSISHISLKLTCTLHGGGKIGLEHVLMLSLKLSNIRRASLFLGTLNGGIRGGPVREDPVAQSIAVRWFKQTQRKQICRTESN